MAVVPMQYEERKGGIGFIGYYLEGQQELHTGHSSSLATWSEAQRQLVKLSRDTNPLQLGYRLQTYISACVLNSVHLSLSHT